MTRIPVFLFLLLAAPFAHALTISWQPPDKDDQGAPLEPGLAFEYRIFGSREGSELRELVTTTARRNVRSPDNGTHCYAIAAAIIDPATGLAGPYGPQSEPKCITVGTPPV